MKKFIPLIIIVATVGGYFFWKSANSKLAKLEVETLELADSPEEQQRGLMGRTDLCSDCGMLFVFEKEGPRSFWMRNTPTSLDMVFMDSTGKITSIHRGTKPNSDTSYLSDGPNKYVLEMPSGYADTQQIKVGQKVDIQALLSSVKS